MNCLSTSIGVGSLMFTPDITLPTLHEMKARFGDKVYGRYGFVHAFHLTNGWINPDVLGIDVGITLLSAENLRRSNVWRCFMRNPEILRVMEKIELHRSKHGFSALLEAVIQLNLVGARSCYENSI